MLRYRQSWQGDNGRAVKERRGLQNFFKIIADRLFPSMESLDMRIKWAANLSAHKVGWRRSDE